MFEQTDCRRATLLAALASATMLLLATMPVLAATDALLVPLVLDDTAQLHAFAMKQQARATAPRFPRAAFLAQPMLREAQLSPDGKQVAALVDEGQGRSVWVASTTQPQGKRLVARTTADQLAWSRDGRWLFLASPTQVYAQAMAGQRGSGAVASLGGRSRREFSGVDPWLPAAVLLVEKPLRASSLPKRWRLWRARPGGRDELLHEGALPLADHAFAPDGRLSHLLLTAGEGHVVLRRTGPVRWQALRVCRRMQRCRFVGTTDAGRSLLMDSNLGGDRVRLLQIDPQGRQRVLHADPRGEADLAGVVLDRVDNRPRIASYRSTIASNHGLDADAQRVLALVARRFPGRVLDLEPANGLDTHWLLHERGDSLRGERLHLVAPTTGEAVAVMSQLDFQNEGKRVARLPEAAMARQVPVAWTASDGMRLHGFLALPPGLDPRRAPLMVLVHGGPFAHVRPEWSTQAQFLANRGHAVFLPNFRSSTGHGRRYIFGGRGDFGGNGRVQRDIDEGTRWLLQNGIGHPDKVGMIGASFGGYATLLALTFQPDLYKVGVASVPPADFGRVVREYAGSTAEMIPGLPIGVSMRHLGVDPADPVVAERLRAQSPITHAKAMRRPLLVFAGGEDDRVPIRGVTHYAALLKSLDKDVSLFIDPDAGHGLVDPRTREAGLYLQEALLQRVFGGAAPEPPSTTLSAHLRRNLRLKGPSLR